MARAVPAWALDTWKELNSDLLSANEDWGVWTSWYEQRLRADTTTQDTEIARVTIDDRIWGSGVKALNAHLKELLNERGIFEDALADDLENPPQVDAIPQQTTAASRLAVEPEGRLDLITDTPSPDGTQRELYQEVRHKALMLSELGHNQLAEMSEPVARFLAATPERIEDVSISALVSRQYFATTT